MSFSSPLWTQAELESLFHVSLEGMQEIQAVKIDSRQGQPGDLFVALKGPTQTGDQFVFDAFARGAAAALVSEACPPTNLENSAQKIIRVPDTLVALQQLATAGRARSEGTIIGITGSFGKTSMKEALRLILSPQGSVTASERSFNNHWGVPLTLAHLRPTDTYGLIEIGMNHKGEIGPLSDLARPHIALITNVRCMHLEALGSLQGIAQEKAALFSGMVPGGRAILNRDDEMFPEVQKAAEKRSLDVISFGRHPQATWRLVESFMKDQHLTVKCSYQTQSFEVTLNNLGAHWDLNVLGLLATTQALDLDPTITLDRLKFYQVPEGRGEVHRLFWKEGEIVVIDESYNAGPDSMKAALVSLGQMKPVPFGRRIAILGDMRELGTAAAYHHEALSEVIQDSGIDLVFTCGVWMKALYDVLPPSVRAAHAEEVSELIPFVLKTVQAGDIIMSKGSKGQYAERGRMYGFVKALLQQSQFLKLETVS